MTAIKSPENRVGKQSGALNDCTLILYSTSACHLCETAHGIIAPLLEALSIGLEEVDISDSETLMARYGIRIPVLKFADQQEELGWPFSESQFLEFVRLYREKTRLS